MTYFEFPYCKVVANTIVACTFDQVRNDNPNVSFPVNPSASVLAEYSVYPLNHDSQTEVDIVERGAIEERDGEYWQTYTGRNKTAEERRQTMVVTMRQARLALLSANNLLASVDTAIAALPDGERETALIEWEYGSTVERLSPLVVSLTSALGQTDESMDNLFELASTL